MTLMISHRPPSWACFLEAASTSPPFKRIGSLIGSSASRSPRSAAPALGGPIRVGRAPAKGATATAETRRPGEKFCHKEKRRPEGRLHEHLLSRPLIAGFSRQCPAHTSSCQGSGRLPAPCRPACIGPCPTDREPDRQTG